MVGYARRLLCGMIQQKRKIASIKNKTMVSGWPVAIQGRRLKGVLPKMNDRFKAKKNFRCNSEPTAPSSDHMMSEHSIQIDRRRVGSPAATSIWTVPCVSSITPPISWATSTSSADKTRDIRSFSGHLEKSSFWYIIDVPTVFTLMSLPRNNELSIVKAASICSGSENSTYAYLEHYIIRNSTRYVHFAHALTLSDGLWTYRTGLLLDWLSHMLGNVLVSPPGWLSSPPKQYPLKTYAARDQKVRSHFQRIHSDYPTVLYLLRCPWQSRYLQRNDLLAPQPPVTPLTYWLPSPFQLPSVSWAEFPTKNESGMMHDTFWLI